MAACPAATTLNGSHFLLFLKMANEQARLPFNKPSPIPKGKDSYALLARDGVALEESANLPAPEVIAADITADLEAAMEQFATIAEDKASPA